MVGIESYVALAQLVEVWVKPEKRFGMLYSQT